MQLIITNAKAALGEIFPAGISRITVRGFLPSNFLSIYRLKADELAELIIEILKYKKILSNDNDYSLKQLKSFVDRIRTGKQDKIDKIVIKSFDLMSAYKLEQLKLETKL